MEPWRPSLRSPVPACVCGNIFTLWMTRVLLLHWPLPVVHWFRKTLRTPPTTDGAYRLPSQPLQSGRPPCKCWSPEGAKPHNYTTYCMIQNFGGGNFLAKHFTLKLVDKYSIFGQGKIFEKDEPKMEKIEKPLKNGKILEKVGCLGFWKQYLAGGIASCNCYFKTSFSKTPHTSWNFRKCSHSTYMVHHPQHDNTTIFFEEWKNLPLVFLFTGS